MKTLELLARLIAVSAVRPDPDRSSVDFVGLADRGIACALFETEGDRKADLVAPRGPGDRPGVSLSGHADVVPVDGQA